MLELWGSACILDSVPLHILHYFMFWSFWVTFGPAFELLEASGEVPRVFLEVWKHFGQQLARKPATFKRGGLSGIFWSAHMDLRAVGLLLDQLWNFWKLLRSSESNFWRVGSTAEWSSRQPWICCPKVARRSKIAFGMFPKASKVTFRKSI